MCVHSPSNAVTSPRYAYFATFFDSSSSDYILLPQRGATAPSFKYPPKMKRALGAYARVCEWEYPVDERSSQWDLRLRFQHFGVPGEESGTAARL